MLFNTFKEFLSWQNSKEQTQTEKKQQKGNGGQIARDIILVNIQKSIREGAMQDAVLGIKKQRDNP